MWNRKELKAWGKSAFKANYWPCVVAALIIAIVGGAIGASGATNGSGGEELSSRAIQVSAGIGSLSLLINIFLVGPLTVGIDHFFKENTHGPVSLNEIGRGFQNYWSNLAGMLVMSIFTFLWALLFIIPGIVKAYSYRMTPYILADNPDMSPTEAITRSREMMDGHKWAAFVLDLSFIGWGLLSVITLGLVGIFYAFPYMCSTSGALYETLKAAEENPEA